MRFLAKLPTPKAFRRLPQKKADQWLWGDRHLIKQDLAGHLTSSLRIVSSIEDPFLPDEVVIVVSPQKGSNTGTKIITRIDLKIFEASTDPVIPAILEREVFAGKFGYSKSPSLWFADFSGISDDSTELRILYSFYPKNWYEALKLLGAEERMKGGSE